MVISCPKHISNSRCSPHPRRPFRQSDRLWSVRRRQVGSVVCESSNAPIPSITHRYADAWGNEMSGYTTGEWTSTWASRDGWGHNTKEYDGDAGLVYMYQRWYQPELGVFMSQAPYPPMQEHPYTFAVQNPVQYFDPLGRDVSNGSCYYLWVRPEDSTSPTWILVCPGESYDGPQDGIYFPPNGKLCYYKTHNGLDIKVTGCDDECEVSDNAWIHSDSDGWHDREWAETNPGVYWEEPNPNPYIPRPIGPGNVPLPD